MICDFHAHLYDEPDYANALVETAHTLSIDKVCIGGGQARYGIACNETVLERTSDYPDLFVPFAAVRLGRDGPDDIARMSEQGFVGLRVIAPPAPYDDDAFFPVYEAAEALDMPIMFHTGMLPPTPLDRALDVRCDRMRPALLDAVARHFPGLSIVGGGLGWPWYEEAAELLSLHTNVFFDLSGTTLRKKTMEFFAGLLGAAPATLLDRPHCGAACHRLLFGTAARHERMPEIECEYERLFRSMALEPSVTEGIMGGTAAKVLGLA